MGLIPEINLFLEHPLLNEKPLLEAANQNLHKSLLVIEKIWPEAHEEIKAFNLGVGWFDDKQRISYSSPKMFGVLFINGRINQSDPIKLATSLIHECGHHALFVETAIDKLIPEDYAIEVYSPLRGTVRPAIGALHGLMAMGRMLVWASHLKKHMGDYKNEGDNIIATLLLKYCDGIRSMDSIQFSERGNAFLSELKFLPQYLGLS